MLWPMLELSLQRDIAVSVLRSDIEVRNLLGKRGVMPRKVEGVVPHDLGSPSEEPWTKVNSYVFQVLTYYFIAMCGGWHASSFILQLTHTAIASGCV